MRNYSQKKKKKRRIKPARILLFSGGLLLLSKREKTRPNIPPSTRSGVVTIYNSQEKEKMSEKGPSFQSSRRGHSSLEGVRKSIRNGTSHVSSSFFLYRRRWWARLLLGRTPSPSNFFLFLCVMDDSPCCCETVWLSRDFSFGENLLLHKR